MWNAEDYVNRLFGADPDLERAAKGIREAGMPEISVAPGYGRLLTILAGASGARDALEIGALGGVSGICIARGLKEGGKLTSLEIKPEYAAIARSHVEAAGLGDRVEYRIGDALQSLEELAGEGRRFDFFFIDADKGRYPDYLEWAIRLARPGAVITADNVLLRGRVGDPGAQGPSVAAMRTFNDRLAHDPRLVATMLPGYDGLAVAFVKDV
ncbi:MAG: methyltransferase [Thermobacillus sp.]|uniref:O-methyltransferase n=1 Tax=Thermobacillus sp. TaxID=2108467 RepID=UPI000E383D87|nr:O-methyltransferase [Thermobacillus sp.]REK59458.1 MAG: methyltransferase [Thermobacillus sp.]